MIYIISEQSDITTDYVIEWLNFFRLEYYRNNFEDQSILNSLEFSSNGLSVSKINGIDIDDVKIVWHRRAYNTFISQNLRTYSSVYRYLKEEEKGGINPIERILKKKTEYIGSFQIDEKYKIDFLLIAKKVGLKIPNTLVTTSKETLTNFYEENNGDIITKDLRFPIRFYESSFVNVSGGTSLVTYEVIEQMDDIFCMSLFQNRIEKEYEIRIFFFNSQLYCMAILSQRDSKTALDFRNYNQLNPNRNIPVILPKNIKLKVLDFINESKLKTGSIDLIVDKNHNYIFLEVNTQGQIDFVSKNCNYYIEKEIAEYFNNNL
ncbi:hypothetical protein IZU89_08600 [Cellulophaga lytica]|uniref:hypothetical protein n=1 Tax=Cellulophaga lytica TaxID=979 RepID=UPI0032E45BAF